MKAEFPNRDGANDPASADYAYAYDNLSRVYSMEQTLVGLTPEISFYFGYDDMSRRTLMYTTFDTTLDFVNSYSYDALGRLKTLKQYGYINVVAEKTVNFTYNAAGQFDTITRYANFAGTQLVATSSYGYDNAGRLSSLTHAKGGSTFAGYGWQWDSANRITQFTNSQHTGENVDYDYDNSGQLTDADYNGGLTDEGYTYDDNGNRIDVDNDFGSETYTTGANNRLEDDGVYAYEHDGEGNLITRTEISSGDYRVFEWDHRNRLASISDFDDTHDLQLKVNYTYDAFDRLVGKRSDTDGNGTINATEAYVYDGNQIVLRFADDDAAALAAADLTNRYLWGPNVDQLLAEENVTSLTSAGTVDWALTDHQNTIRDWASYSGGTTTIADHAEYDAFGNRLNAPAVDAVFGWATLRYDADTGFYASQTRWYDPLTGQWISEDWISFAGGDANLRRYVGNAPTIYVDPTGLATSVPQAILQALAQGNIKLAMELLSGLGASAGAAVYGGIINKIYDKWPAASLQCQTAAREVQKVFRIIEQKSEIIMVIGARGERFLSVAGKRFSESGKHFVVYRNGRIYDAFTRAPGMTVQEYITYWQTHVGTSPIINPANPIVK